MLPIATPPNALVYGTGYIEQKQMLKTGMILNIFSICVVFALVSFLI
jgi:sodium-dependent dicarboxylate transporter 2/3/5